MQTNAAPLNLHCGLDVAASSFRLKAVAADHLQREFLCRDSLAAVHQYLSCRETERREALVPNPSVGAATTLVAAKGSWFLPDTSSAQRMPIRIRAATRDAMSSSLVPQCELGFSSAWLALREVCCSEVQRLRCIYTCKVESESVILSLDFADWKSGKVATCPHLSVVSSPPPAFFFFL